MRVTIAIVGCFAAVLLGGGGMQCGIAEDDVIAFAVVSEPPKDKTRVAAKVAIDGTATDLKLLASDQIVSNPIWK